MIVHIINVAHQILIIEMQSGWFLQIHEIPDMRVIFPRNFRFTHNWVVSSILLISFLVRCILILRGGQYFNSDETRYEVSRAVARFLWQGQPGEALRQFTISPEHLGFKVAGIIPALAEQIVGPSLVLPAIFYSLFSILSLYLIFLLSQHSQTSPNESLYALFFAASCLSLLYYSRHLFPYDMAMSLGLLALYIALTRKQTMGTSFVCGGLGFLCFITYNGYWPLAGFAMLANILMNSENTNRRLQRTMVTTISFVLPLALLITTMQWFGTDLVAEYHLFSTTITQGSFQEGWSLPFAYFWHTEHTFILILGTLSTLAVISQSKDARPDKNLWAVGILFIYLCLAIPSVILHYFVVYARLARQLMPFLVLLAAQGLVQMEDRAVSGRMTIRLILAVVFIQAAWNFTYFYSLSYPREFAAEAQTKFPEFEFSSKRLTFGAPVICHRNGYVIQNTKFYVVPPERVPEVTGQLLLSASHPANSLPYQYEGDPPQVREVYSKLKLRMNFYKADEQFMSETNPDWKAIKDCVVREE